MCLFLLTVGTLTLNFSVIKRDEKENTSSSLWGGHECVSYSDTSRGHIRMLEGHNWSVEGHQLGRRLHLKERRTHIKGGIPFKKKTFGWTGNTQNPSLRGVGWIILNKPRIKFDPRRFSTLNPRSFLWPTGRPWSVMGPALWPQHTAPQHLCSCF